jgi:hypothetical protein
MHTVDEAEVEDGSGCATSADLRPTLTSRGAALHLRYATSTDREVRVACILALYNYALDAETDAFVYL